MTKIDKRDILSTSIRNVEELKRRYNLEKETEINLSNYLSSDILPLEVGKGGTGIQAFTKGSYLVGNGSSSLTEKTAEEVANDIEEYLTFDTSDLAKKPVLLWNNESPTSNFAAQTINLTNISYDIITISFRWSTSDMGGAAPLLCIKGAGQAGATSYEVNRVQRYATYNSTGTVTFSSGLYNGNSNNAYCIPTHIWGI